MGTLYSPIPISDEAREWLASEGFDSPDVDGRRPTPNELMEILNSLDAQTIDYSISANNWQAQISDSQSVETEAWALLNVQNYNDNPDDPCDFYFAKGLPELIVQIVFRICKQFGPYIVVPDTDCCPLIIHADSNVDNLLDSWEHIVGE